MYNQSRMAMFRMTSELRYAEKLVQLDDHVLEFKTRYLVDSDPQIETVKYEWIFYQLYRSVDGSAPVDITFAQDTALKFTGYKIDASGNLVPLDLAGGDTIDNAVAVGIDLTEAFQDSSLKFGSVYFTFNSLAAMRNM